MDEGLIYYKIELDEVRKKLSKLNPRKPPGSNNIHPRILKEMSGVLDKASGNIIPKYTGKRKDTNDWKYAKVTAIFKKGE